MAGNYHRRLGPSSASPALAPSAAGDGMTPDNPCSIGKSMAGCSTGCWPGRFLPTAPRLPEQPVWVCWSREGTGWAALAQQHTRKLHLLLLGPSRQCRVG